MKNKIESVKSFGHFLGMVGVGTALLITGAVAGTANGLHNAIKKAVESSDKEGK